MSILWSGVWFDRASFKNRIETEIHSKNSAFVVPVHDNEEREAICRWVKTIIRNGRCATLDINASEPVYFREKLIAIASCVNDDESNAFIESVNAMARRAESSQNGSTLNIACGNLNSNVSVAEVTQILNAFYKSESPAQSLIKENLQGLVLDLVRLLSATRTVVIASVDAGSAKGDEKSRSEILRLLNLFGVACASSDAVSIVVIVKYDKDIVASLNGYKRMSPVPLGLARDDAFSALTGHADYAKAEQYVRGVYAHACAASPDGIVSYGELVRAMCEF